MAGTRPICYPGARPLVRGGKDGVLLPVVYLGDHLHSQALEVAAYILGLIWCMFGHALVSEYMLASIDKITQKRRMIRDKRTGQMVTVKVWLETVANFTLVGLGSRVPQIVLPIFEVFTGDFLYGDLGLWTITSSAAFELFFGMAIFVWAIPSGEVRSIKSHTTFVVAAVASVLAYAWLLFAVRMISRDHVEVPEAVGTLLYHPVFVYVAYFVSTRSRTAQERKLQKLSISEETTEGDLARMVATLHQRYGKVSDEQLKALLEHEFLAPRSRAYHRVNATRTLFQGKRLGQLGSLEQDVARKISDPSRRALLEPSAQPASTPAKPTNVRQDPWLRGHEFYFIHAGKLKSTSKGWKLPRFQELVNMDGWLHRFRIDIDSVESRTLSDSFAALSHVWQSPGMPDPEGEQVAALKNYLRGAKGSRIKYVWIDYCCLPQGENRTDKQKNLFVAGLKAMNLVYLACHIIVMVDNQYLGRFWTQFEAFSAFQEATEDGLMSSKKVRHDFVFTGLALDEEDLITEMLKKRWEKATVAVAVKKLSKNDVKVTNEGDKDVQLEKLTALNSRVGDLVRSRRLPGLHGAAGVPAATVGKPLRAGEMQEPPGEGSVFAFANCYYSVPKSSGAVSITVKRTGAISQVATVDYETIDGTAFAVTDYKTASGRLNFAEGETQKDVELQIFDSSEFYEIEDFYVELLSTGPDCSLGKQSTTTVVILDEGKPGMLSFESEELKIEEAVETRLLKVTITRTHGASGEVGCCYRTEADTARPGKEYEHCEGTLVFQPGQTLASFDVQILPSGVYEDKETFRIVLSDATGNAYFDPCTDGGADGCILTVSIVADKTVKDRVDKLNRLLKVDVETLNLGHANWKDQFVAAIYAGGSREAHVEATCWQWTLHVVGLPWKLLFAIIPPTDFCGGWLTFFFSLLFTVFVTAITRDMALLGTCTMVIQDSIAFVTYVPLGLSLPNILASRSSAVEEANADNCINSVLGAVPITVFFGMGIAWLIGSIRDKDRGGYLVPSERIWPSLATFLACSVACLAALALRRRLLGAELGGSEGWKAATSVFFVLLWLLYIVVSILSVSTHLFDSCC